MQQNMKEICTMCVHYQPNESERYMSRTHPACDAYPQGIPPTILLGQADHRQPQPFDHGIQFELDTKVFDPADPWVINRLAMYDLELKDVEAQLREAQNNG